MDLSSSGVNFGGTIRYLAESMEMRCETESSES